MWKLNISRQFLDSNVLAKLDLLIHFMFSNAFYTVFVILISPYYDIMMITRNSLSQNCVT